MLQSVARSARCHGHADAARNQREHMRGAFHEFLHVGDTGQRVLDNAFIFMRETGLSAELLDVVTIGFSARNASSRSMRLLQEAGVSQVRHHVTDGGRAQTLAAGARKSARTYRLAGGDISLDDGGQDLPFPIACWSWWHGLPESGA